jgi:toxin ParE1/3/4
MTRYVLSPRAKSDLDGIWDYTCKNWGEQQAILYIRIIQTAIEAVASNPRLGKSCDHIREGYRKFPAGSHMLFFRLAAGEIDVVRILHRRMDFKRHF